MSLTLNSIVVVQLNRNVFWTGSAEHRTRDLAEDKNG